jgi:hypothetical protein
MANKVGPSEKSSNSSSSSGSSYSGSYETTTTATTTADTGSSSTYYSSASHLAVRGIFFFFFFEFLIYLKSKKWWFGVIFRSHFARCLFSSGRSFWDVVPSLFGTWRCCMEHVRVVVAGVIFLYRMWAGLRCCVRFFGSHGPHWEILPACLECFFFFSFFLFFLFLARLYAQPFFLHIYLI